MPQSQLLSSIIALAAIERPACPKCRAQMMLARIVPAFSGTDLHTFECTLCNHVLKKLGACGDWLAAWDRCDHQARGPIILASRSIRARWPAAP
jgi:hypothetical protein